MNLNNMHDIDKIKGCSDKIDFVLNDLMKNSIIFIYIRKYLKHQLKI